jgi:hypothetical protein
MQIGEPQRIIEVVPLDIPSDVPDEQPQPEPIEVPDHEEVPA